MVAGGSIDPGVPQLAESSLAAAAVSVSELQCPGGSLLAAAYARTMRPRHTAGLLTNFLMAAVGGLTSFNAHA